MDYIQENVGARLKEVNQVPRSSMNGGRRLPPTYLQYGFVYNIHCSITYPHSLQEEKLSVCI